MVRKFRLGGVLALSTASALALAQSSTATLVPADSSAEDRFGWSVAIEGRTLAVSAPQDFAPGGAGVVYVFARSGGQWVQQARLTSPDPRADDTFGGAIALDGDRLGVGATADDTEAGTNTGAVYVFARSDSGTPDTAADDTWSLEAAITPADAQPFDLFGISVALDGAALVVGAWGESTFGNLAGSAYVFRRVGDSWIQEAKLYASDAAGSDRFGVSVAIDGSVVVVGANGDSSFTVVRAAGRGDGRGRNPLNRRGGGARGGGTSDCRSAPGLILDRRH